MQIRAIVLEQADFDEWVRLQQQPATLPTSGAAAEGATLFDQHCTTCHEIDGVFESDSDEIALLTANVAPNLTHLMSRTSFAGALFDLYNDDGTLNVADLREWVRDAPHLKPMNPDNFQGMVSFVDTLNEEDLDNIVAFLQTLGSQPILPN